MEFHFLCHSLETRKKERRAPKNGAQKENDNKANKGSGGVLFTITQSSTYSGDWQKKKGGGGMHEHEEEGVETQTQAKKKKKKATNRQ